ncbi:ABC transporter permease [Hollandina sp. SP2]
MVHNPALMLPQSVYAQTRKADLTGLKALGIVYVPMLTRLVRSLTLIEKTKTYVEAAESIGFSRWYIMFRHIFPNCLDTVMVQLTLDLVYGVLDLAVLSFLGLGVHPLTADWGGHARWGPQLPASKSPPRACPGAAMVITVVSLNLFCDCVSQYMDPKTGSFHPLSRWRKNRDIRQT